MIQKCLKAVFDKTAFVKFIISNNFKQNMHKTHSKLPKIHWEIHTSLWIFEISRKNFREPKVLRLLPNVCDFQKENHAQGYGFNNYQCPAV
jgi:hypothetical protein